MAGLSPTSETAVALIYDHGMSDEQHDTIDALASENRTFPPSEMLQA